MSRSSYAVHSPAPAKQLIMLALAQGSNHGYTLHDQIVGDTIGSYVRKSSLYRGLAELSVDGLIEPAGDAGDGTARSYRLTPDGRNVLRGLAATWERLGLLANQRLR